MLVSNLYRFMIASHLEEFGPFVHLALRDCDISLKAIVAVLEAGLKTSLQRAQTHLL